MRPHPNAGAAQQIILCVPDSTNRRRTHPDPHRLRMALSTHRHGPRQAPFSNTRPPDRHRTRPSPHPRIRRGTPARDSRSGHRRIQLELDHHPINALPIHPSLQLRSSRTRMEPSGSFAAQHRKRRRRTSRSDHRGSNTVTPGFSWPFLRRITRALLRRPISGSNRRPGFAGPASRIGMDRALRIPTKASQTWCNVISPRSGPRATGHRPLRPRYVIRRFAAHPEAGRESGQPSHGRIRHLTAGSRSSENATGNLADSPSSLVPAKKLSRVGELSGMPAHQCGGSVRVRRSPHHNSLGVQLHRRPTGRAGRLGESLTQRKAHHRRQKRPLDPFRRTGIGDRIHPRNAMTHRGARTRACRVHTRVNARNSATKVFAEVRAQRLTPTDKACTDPPSP